MVLLHLREGERPGGRYWQRVIIHELPTTLSQQVGTAALIEATSGLFDIGSGLIQSQRQPTPLLTDGTCCASVVFRSLFKGCIRSHSASAAQQEECPQLG